MGVDSSKSISHRNDLDPLFASGNISVADRASQRHQQPSPKTTPQLSVALQGKLPEQRRQAVLEKLQKIYKDLNPKDLGTFADILSDKQKLMRVYLHTDFSEAQALVSYSPTTFVPLVTVIFIRNTDSNKPLTKRLQLHPFRRNVQL